MTAEEMNEVERCGPAVVGNAFQKPEMAEVRQAKGQVEKGQSDRPWTACGLYQWARAHEIVFDIWVLKISSWSLIDKTSSSMEGTQRGGPPGMFMSTQIEF